MKLAEDLRDLTRAFVAVVERIAEGDSGPGQDDWMDQSSSELGPRLHIRAVRRRMAEGTGGAKVRNRRYLLTREALREEMMRSPKPGLRKTTGRTETRSSVARDTTARLRRLRKPQE